ncbi:hypothetical protein LCGC14_2242210 [marine sediment metagenome]|uniref:SDR family NAD(P)-dependent oxidoreductase n=2 Tax=root TaxID=1 RepID=A0A831QVE0_9FLAO|nr:SDR family NAD(P)-dependent oxidoreductase [Pricia antarctica]
MSKIFITGSTDGLGLLAAERLIAKGHEVVLHARNAAKAKAVLQKLPKAFQVVAGDLSSMAETKKLAQQVNEIGRMDSVIYNAGIGFQETERGETKDGLPRVFAINSLAPYILTCLLQKPKRLIYTSSGMHNGGDATLNDMLWERKRWNGSQAYSDSKLQNILLAFAVGRKWNDVFANAVSPGWVATKMGGSHAPDSLEKAPETQVWLAVSDTPEAQVSGNYFYHQEREKYRTECDDVATQEKYLAQCQQISGLSLP